MPVTSPVKIAFIIVTFNEVFYDTITFRLLIESINESKLKEFDILIYDNSDRKGWNVAFDQVPYKEHIHYHHDAGNSGISIAYNRMAETAKERGSNWIVLLDQDTTLPLNSVSEYLKGAGNENNVFLKVPLLLAQSKIFSPLRLVLKRGIPIDTITPGVLSFKKLVFVNSGAMIYLPFFMQVGGYNERIKLDFADFQFIEKAKRHTDKFELLPIVCSQNFSHFEHDKEAALLRYSIYIKDIANCKRYTFGDGFGYLVSSLLHSLKLTYKYRTFKFIQLFIDHNVNRSNR